MTIVSMIVFSIISSLVWPVLRYSPLIVAGRLMSETVPAIIHVDCGVRSPIGMKAFVIVEAAEPDLIAGNPDVAGSQIDIAAADETDEFDAVPNIRIRNEDYGFGRHNNRGRRRSDHYRSWCNDDRLERDAPVRLNDTASN